jgi:hypothetical protein
MENNAFTGENSGVDESAVCDGLTGTDSVHNVELESIEESFLLNSTYVPMERRELSIENVCNNEGALENS